MNRMRLRETVFYGSLILISLLLGLVCYPAVWLKIETLSAYLRYVINLYLISGVWMMGPLAMATRRSKLFGGILTAVCVAALLLPQIPNILLELRLGRTSWLGNLFVAVPILLCFGVALLCRLSRHNFAAYLISVAVPIAGYLLRNGLNVTLAAVPLLYGMALALLLYPISVGLRGLLFRPAPIKE